MTDIDKLLQIMAKLRAPDGCPWDREQTSESLKPMLVEEAFEVLHAIDSGDPAEIRDELGDLLLQVVFHSQLASEQGQFAMQDVIDSICTKIIRRHPHVFGEVKADTSGEVLKNWDRIKKEELLEKKKERKSLLDGIAPGLPALYEAYQLGVKAARAGFDWETVHGILAKTQEELVELEAQLDPANENRIKEEIGDILFAAVNLCRFLNVDPETSLKQANRKFTRRFQYMESCLSKEDKHFRDCSLEELERYWQESKQWVN